MPLTVPASAGQDRWSGFVEPEPGCVGDPTISSAFQPLPSQMGQTSSEAFMNYVGLFWSIDFAPARR